MNARTWTALAITASVGLLGAPRDARAAAETETFTATLLRDADMRSSTNRTWPLTFRVQNWTSEDQLAHLDVALKEGGPDALLREFRKGKAQAGYVTSSAIVREPSWRVAMATSTETARGRVVRLVTDRPIGFAEAWGGSRSLDYPFAVFEFTLDAKGEGRGTAIAAARLVQDEDGTLAFETLPFTTGPDKLLGVRRWGSN